MASVKSVTVHTEATEEAHLNSTDSKTLMVTVELKTMLEMQEAMNQRTAE
jgi:hypothetical protein